jgi:flavodoxin
MSGKSLIVYYSWVGNTEMVAKEIQRQTGFDIQRIEEKKERKKGKIMGAAMGAVLGFKSGLKAMDFMLEDYENIYLGAQVWAGKTTPAINKYLSKVHLKDKKVRLFITKSDKMVPQKVIDSITCRIEKKGGKVIDNISFTTTWEPGKNNVISQEEVKDSIQEWLKKAQI